MAVFFLRCRWRRNEKKKNVQRKQSRNCGLRYSNKKEVNKKYQIVRSFSEKTVIKIFGEEWKKEKKNIKEKNSKNAL